MHLRLDSTSGCGGLSIPQQTPCAMYVSHMCRQRTWRQALAAEAGQWLRAPKRRQLPALLAAQDPGGGVACDVACALVGCGSSTTSPCGTAACQPWCRRLTDAYWHLSKDDFVQVRCWMQITDETKPSDHNKTLVWAELPHGQSFLHSRNTVPWQIVGMRSKGPPATSPAS